MVSMGQLGIAFNLIALACANVDVDDVQLSVNVGCGSDGELDPSVMVRVVAPDQKSAIAVASLLGLNSTLPDTWSGTVTHGSAVLPARCTVTSWRATDPASRAEHERLRRPGQRVAS
jgi:hypothetical protein